ncbi:hypothetical protein Tco_0629438 [Tanacetum coccineum]|uniref:CCHC-type domain-containing protein n=1 Tax=Tanacetum coccineum TaxID=301880 RepID=A0ABQ4WT68_9ASTR
MASFDYRLNPLYAIKECSSCGTLCTRDCGCSKGGLEDKILVPIPDLSRRPLKIEKICLDCGDPVHGLYCRQCALIRKTLEEVFQDFQDTSKSSDDDTNFVNQEPFVVKQGPGVNSSQSPPQIDHECCYECGDSLDGIFCQRCTCKSCGKGAHIGYNCPPQIPIISNPEPCYNQNLNEILQNLQSLQQQCLLGTCQQCGCNEYDGVCFYCTVGNGTPINFSTPYSSNDSPSVANHPPQPQYVPYSCELCGNDSHYGYDCPPQVPFVYNQDPCFNQNFDYFPQTSPSFPQQYSCCEDCGGPHETYQCQPMNEDYYHEQNPCYDSNSFGFDQFQPPQYTVNHPIFNAQNSLLNSQNEFLNSQNKLMEQMTSMCDMVGQFIQKKEEEKRIEEEQAAKDRYWKIPVCYDDDDDEESSIPLKDIISELPSYVAITPDSRKTNSLIKEDEHLDTIPETESDELIKSSVKDLVQIPSESDDSSEGECDLPPYDDSSKNHDLTFSNPLFDINEDFTSSDESFTEEDVPNENFKIFSNPLFDLDEEITSTKVDQIDDELHRDTSINDSQKIDSLLDEFAGELTLLKSIPPGIDMTTLIRKVKFILLRDCFITTLLPALRKNLILKILPDGNSIPPGIESDDFDSEDDDNSTSRPEFESFHVDYPYSGDSTIDVVEDILVDVPNIFPPISSFNWISTSFLLMISDPILMLLLLPEIETRFTIQGYALKSNPREFLLLFPPISQIFEASRARSFCPSITRALHPQLHLGIRYPNLID